MSLFKGIKEEEIVYNDKFIWMFNAWFERFIEPGRQIGSLRKVEDESKIPQEYFDYYNESLNESPY